MKIQKIYLGITYFFSKSLFLYSRSNRIPCDPCHYTILKTNALQEHIETEHGGLR